MDENLFCGDLVDLLSLPANEWAAEVPAVPPRTYTDWLNHAQERTGKGLHELSAEDMVATGLPAAVVTDIRVYQAVATQMYGSSLSLTAQTFAENRRFVCRLPPTMREYVRELRREMLARELEKICSAIFGRAVNALLMSTQEMVQLMAAKDMSPVLRDYVKSLRHRTYCLSTDIRPCPETHERLEDAQDRVAEYLRQTDRYWELPMNEFYQLCGYMSPLEIVVARRLRARNRRLYLHVKKPAVQATAGGLAAAAALLAGRDFLTCEVATFRMMIYRLDDAGRRSATKLRQVGLMRFRNGLSVDLQCLCAIVSRSLPGAP